MFLKLVAIHEGEEKSTSNKRVEVDFPFSFLRDIFQFADKELVQELSTQSWFALDKYCLQMIYDNKPELLPYLLYLIEKIPSDKKDEVDRWFKKLSHSTRKKMYLKLVRLRLMEQLGSIESVKLVFKYMLNHKDSENDYNLFEDVVEEEDGEGDGEGDIEGDESEQDEE